MDPRFCDERFRLALKNLREHPCAAALEIVGEGWSGAHYYIEYALTPDWQTMEESFAATAHRWYARLPALVRVCDALATWQRSRMLPLGLSVRSIGLAGDGTPTLVPCPPVTLSSARDLFGLDAPVLAATAPETVRRVQLNPYAEDCYALGVLVAQALGFPTTGAVIDDESRVEAQARGALLLAALERSTVDTFLRDTPPLRQLMQTVARYRHSVPDARPPDAGAMRAALEPVADPVALARALRAAGSDGALDVLTRSFDSSAASAIRCREEAAAICQEDGDWAAAVAYLDEAIAIAPNQLSLREGRCEALWRLFAVAPDDAFEPADRLLEDIQFLTRLAERRDIAGLRGRAAAVHRGRGDHHEEAAELYAASRADPENVALLVEYLRCLLDLRDPDSATRVAQTARRRIAGLVTAGRMMEGAAHRWNARIDELLGQLPAS
ncbi:hypothetical protein Vau01_078230 [Virgisporangium aurantiacum]|uniref:Tetratricopeptide repeat-containing protein n=1 Tax=Virgisporangium aurantiacum TaxID=175570 RepID=A0A8J3ZCB3_9ACTN|nr:hypothetical protein Vau01_078230 [Virgisporangium aurantiacum]